MKTASLAFVLAGVACIILASIPFITIITSSDNSKSNFGIAICKRSEDRWMGKFYITEYFLVDQKGKTLQIDRNVFDALTLQECE
jgi:hypothetical protein